MTILAVETLGRNFSIALRNFETTKVLHGQEVIRSLPSSIDSLLKENHVDYTQLQMLFIVTGPGSFTAIRAGLALLQGIRAVIEKPIYGITIFQVYAFKAMNILNAQNIFDQELGVLVKGYKKSLMCFQKFSTSPLLPLYEPLLVPIQNFKEERGVTYCGLNGLQFDIDAQDVIEATQHELAYGKQVSINPEPMCLFSNEYTKWGNNAQNTKKSS